MTTSVSRRWFLRGAGAGGVALVGEACSAAIADEATGVGLGAAPITLTISGAARAVRVEPNATLAEVLRGPLDLTGTKIGCDRGACSAAGRTALPGTTPRRHAYKLPIFAILVRRTVLQAAGKEMVQ